MALSKALDGITPDTKGVALIISNDYAGCPGVSVLNGTHKDSAKLEVVFQQFQYKVYRAKNAKKEYFKKLLEILSKHQYPPTCHRLIVAFAGHGDDGVLLSQDGCEFNIESIVDQFKPGSHNNTLGNTARIFFIDACRGTCDDTGYTRACQGAEDVAWFRQKFSTEGNILVAYSSTRYHPSFETDKGGLWTSQLVTELKLNKSLLEILTSVNAKISENPIKGCFQIGEFTSSLKETINFVEECQGNKL